MPEKPPHVLILTSDEHAARVMGCMGDPVARTPNLDRLASRGVLFERAYCNNPICVPGRYSILTGRLPRQIGSLYYGHGLDPGTWTYPKHFARAGYQTTCVGKMHFMGLEQMHGWMFRPFGDMENLDHAMVPGFAGDPYVGTAPRRPTLVDHVRGARAGTDGFIVFDESVTREARITLLDYFRSIILPIYSPDRPLMLQVSWKTPHWPFIAPPEYFNYYLDRVSPPDIPPPPPEKQHPYMAACNRRDQNTDEEILRARAAYWGLVQYLDRQVGIVLGTLEELGVLDEFLIFYHSDHGEMAGNFGAWGKGCMHEDAVRVPFIASWPGRIPQGARVTENVSMLDLFPTLCDYCGLEPPGRLRGDSLRPLIQGDSRSFSERTVLAEYYPGGYRGGDSPDCGALMMALRGHTKLITYPRPGHPAQLFDLRDDPKELDSHAADADYASIRGELQREIDALPEPFVWDEQAESDRQAAQAG